MKLTILPDNLEVDFQQGENLLDVIRRTGINLASSCGGAGTCGKCRVEIKKRLALSAINAESESFQEVLACRHVLESEPTVVNIPVDERRITNHKVLINEVNLTNPYPLNPSFKKIAISMDKPSLDNNLDDLTRLMVELRKKTGYEFINMSLEMMQKLPVVVREGDWNVVVGLQEIINWQNSEKANKVHEITSLEPGGIIEEYYGAAIDIGTTTVKINLLDLQTGEVVGSGGEYNSQQRYGDDVINRIIYSDEEKDGREKLKSAVMESLNAILKGILTDTGIKSENIHMAVVAGNTTMIHLFTGIPAKHIRLEPYVPAVGSPLPIKAGEIGLDINSNGYVFFLPSIGSYVGGDITAGVLSTGLARNENVSLLIDIGTNGEIVLGNKEWQISCACSAGPCFEGSGIKYGMRAMAGAIDGITFTRENSVVVSTINQSKPVGICGSGLINITAALMKQNILDRTGHFDKTLVDDRLREGEEGWEYVIVPDKDTGHGKDIVILETDIQNIIRAKAAIYAGVRILLKHMGMSFDDISEVLIAGGFGNSLDIKQAVTIGMLPDIPLEKYRYVGNSAIKGAQMVLSSMDAFKEISNLATGMTYLDLSVGNDFMDEFVSAMFLPHTDFSQFPSVV